MMDDSTSHKEPNTHPIYLPVSLPPEIWRKIISFTARSSLGSRIDLEDAFEASYREVDELESPDLLSDRKSLAWVCSSWRCAVTDISAECLTIRSSKTLAAVVKAFEHSKMQKNRTGRHLGEMTRRIDVREFANWNHDMQLVRLLKCTPNLLIYTHNDFHMPPEPATISQEVLETLIMYCSGSLQRIGWRTVIGKLLSYQNIVKLCNASPGLTTLSLSSTLTVSNPDEHSSASLLYLPKLKTLSLTFIPSRILFTNTPWDYFVRQISLDSKQLTSLERFDCNRFPPNAMSFFRVHGHKIRQLQISQHQANDIVGAIELCPKLESLVINECRKDGSFPSAHPSLARISIHSNSFFVSAEIEDHLLGSIEKMDAPCLKKVQLRRDALAACIDFRLRSWWGRLNVRGVCFVDEMGASFESMPDPDFVDYLFDLDDGPFD